MSDKKTQKVDVPESVKAMLDSTPNYATIVGFNHTGNKKLKEVDRVSGFILRWGKKGTGWGEITFVVGKDGKVRIESEAKGPDFTKEMLNALVDGAEFVE